MLSSRRLQRNGDDDLNEELNRRARQNRRRHRLFGLEFWTAIARTALSPCWLDTSWGGTVVMPHMQADVTQEIVRDPSYTLNAIKAGGSLNGFEESRQLHSSRTLNNQVCRSSSYILLMAGADNLN